ncbi:MAG: accessory gene regulator B family protein [Bacilli bacterium]|nr:accessory gene regulator B family protein [Bacilli bacterium]
MKELVVGCSMDLIKKQYPQYNETKLAEIKYGLASIYITISKTIVICAIAYIMGILKELVIFTIIYNIIRMPSFGLHATKSWICLVSSTLIFIGSTYLCSIVTISLLLKIILGIVGILLIFKNSPADTEKKPIVNPKRRLAYKIISTIIAIIFVVLSITIPDNFLSNSFIVSLIIQCFMTSKSVYKLFGLPYDNYKHYQL